MRSSHTAMAPFGMSSIWNITPVMTSETIQGTKISMRTMPRNFIFRFSSSAMPMAMGPWSSSDRIAMRKLLRTASQKNGCPNIRPPVKMLMKLSRPTKLFSGAIREPSCKDMTTPKPIGTNTKAT